MALFESHCKGTTKTAHLQERTKDSYPNLGQYLSSVISFTGKPSPIKTMTESQCVAELFKLYQQLTK